MIFVIGGRNQGKTGLARSLAEEIVKERPLRVADGRDAEPESFLEADLILHLEDGIRRLMRRRYELSSDAGEGGSAEASGGDYSHRSDSDKKDSAEADSGAWGSLHDFASLLIRQNPAVVITADEIGCGIVPADAFEREYREVDGRICQQIAAASDAVFRVVCGIGTRIK